MAHRIVSIEGEGDWRGKAKLADSLVRGSPIFWRMAHKIKKLRSALGFQKYSRLKTKDKLIAVQKELKLFKKEHQKELSKQVKAIQREADKKVRAAQAMIVRRDELLKKKDERIVTLEKKVKSITNSARGNIWKLQQINAKLRIKTKIYDKYKDFFTAKVSWQKNNFYTNNEVWIRYLLAQEELKRNNNLLNTHYYVLLTSLYFDYVTVEILVNRSGWSMSAIQKAIRDLISKELMYHDTTYRYIPSEKGIKIAKEMSHMVSALARRTYFSKDPRPRVILEERVKVKRI